MFDDYLKITFTLSLEEEKRTINKSFWFIFPVLEKEDQHLAIEMAVLIEGLLCIVYHDTFVPHSTADVQGPSQAEKLLKVLLLQETTVALLPQARFTRVINSLRLWHSFDWFVIGFFKVTKEKLYVPLALEGIHSRSVTKGCVVRIVIGGRLVALSLKFVDCP